MTLSFPEADISFFKKCLSVFSLVFFSMLFFLFVFVCLFVVFVGIFCF